MTARAFVQRVLLFFVASVPVVGWAVEFGVALTASHAAAVLLCLIAAVVWLRTRPRVPNDLTVIGLTALLFVAVLTVLRVQLQPDLVLLGDSAHAKSIKQLVGLAFGWAVFMALYSLLRWYGLGLTVLRAHYWATVTVALLTIAQYGLALADMSSPLANLPVHNSTLGGTRPLSLMYGFPRVSLTMVEPSMLATYLLTGWGLWLGLVDRPRLLADAGRRLVIASGIPIGVSVLVTGSRLAYAVFALLVLAAVVARPHRLRRIALVGASTVIALMLTGPAHVRGIAASLFPALGSSAAVASPGQSARAEPEVTGPEIAESMPIETAVQAYDQSVQQRAVSYLVALTVLRMHPLLGTGFGTSGFYMERYWPSSLGALPPTRVAPATMMSHYSTIATETGLLGLLCLVVFAAGVVRRLWRLWGRSGEDGPALAFGLGAAVAGYAIGSAATALVVYQILLVWLLLAVALTAGDRRETEGKLSV